jgi:Glutathione S-transferase
VIFTITEKLNMEPVLFYGFPAGSSMGLVAALEWLGKPYKLCRIDMLGEMREPPYKRINPRVETPSFITDEGVVLTETMAIAAWLEARDTERRISFAPLSREADRMHQLMAFINTGFTGAFSPLWVALEMIPPNPAMQSALRTWGRERVIERHDRLEEMLGDTPYLVAERPTLADALLIGVARWLDVHQVADKGRWPKLAAVRQHLEADAAVTYASALESGHEQKGSGACQGHVGLEDMVKRFGSQRGSLAEAIGPEN